MDSDCFDLIARAAGQRTRRDALRLVVGAGLGAGTLAALAGEADARNRNKKNGKKKRHKHQCKGPTGICNADPTPCGTSATGETCGCEQSVEGKRFCADGAHPCAQAVECTSTNGKNDPTSCRNLVGFHFVCQEAKSAGGKFCGCGFGTTTGRVCVAECDNPN
jgi:hypothetical protein